MKKRLSIVIGIVKNTDGEMFISRRRNELHQGGLWEFSGGKVENGETLQTALARELKEEIGIEVILAKPLISLQYDYADRFVTLHVFEITKFFGEPTSLLNQETAWVKVSDLDNYEFPAANRAILNALKLPSFYAILNEASLFKLQHLLSQNLKLIQARLKNETESQVREFLDIALPLCQKHQSVLLLNSGVEKALELQKNGVHLTSVDLLKLEKRPENLTWLSASCHNLNELQHAEKIGVDFVVIAPVLKTRTHPEIEPLGWNVFSELVAACNLPVYALGGLKKSDLETAQSFGAQGISGISTFLQHTKTLTH
jgi:8-oxo-dGTP diphosphatase